MAFKTVERFKRGALRRQTIHNMTERRKQTTLQRIVHE